VPKVVKADGVGEASLVEEGLERAAEDIVAVKGRADSRGEHESVVLPEPVKLLSLFCLTLLVGTQRL
jgi:hypothetical protein